MRTMIGVVVLVGLGLLAGVVMVAGCILMFNAVMLKLTLLGGVLFIVGAASCVIIGTRIINIIKNSLQC